MSDPTYDQNALVHYLLGSLPEAETQRLDELSIADAALAAKLEAAENDLIDAYVHGELTGETLEKFRTYYLASPTRRERVKFASALQEFSGSEEAPAIEAKSRESVSAKRGWWAGVFAIPAFQWGVGFAMLGLLLLGGWLVIDNVRLRRQNAESIATQNELARHEQELQAEVEGRRNAVKQSEEELAQVRAEQQSKAEQQKPSEPGLIATMFLTPQLRGNGQPPTLKIEPMTKSVAAHLTLDPNDFSAYQAVLIDLTNRRTVWSSGNLRARTKGDGKVLTVTFPAERLKPQSYALRISGVAAGAAPELISDYPFRVVK